MTSETDCRASAAAQQSFECRALPARQNVRNDEGPEIGDKVRFTPAANFNKSEGFCGELLPPVTGTVVQVNEAHRWYRVRYEVSGCIRYEAFKY